MTNHKYQFGHIQTYSRSVSKKRKESASWSISDIVAEASRIPEASKHVPNPERPIHVAGCPISDLEKEVELQVGKARMPDGRLLRKDTHVLLACVYSWPEHKNYFDKEKFELWVADTLEFHKSEFEKVDCAVVHLDESFPHLHVYTISADARNLSPGWKAKRLSVSVSESQDKDKKVALRDGNIAYRIAMKDWQDRYHENVGQFHALDRLGPKRRRISRNDYRKGKNARRYEAELRFAERSKLKQEAKLLEDAHERAQISLQLANEEVKIATYEKEKAHKKLDEAHKAHINAITMLNDAKTSAARLAPWLSATSVIVEIFWTIVKQFGLEPPSVKKLRKQAARLISEYEIKYQNLVSEYDSKMLNLNVKLKAEKEKQLQLNHEFSKLKLNNESATLRMSELEKNNKELIIENAQLQNIIEVQKLSFEKPI